MLFGGTHSNVSVALEVGEAKHILETTSSFRKHVSSQVRPAKEQL